MDDIYEFQTALVTEKDNVISYINNMSTKFKQSPELKALPIPVLPEVVDYQSIASEVGKSKNIVIGIDKNELEIINYDFIKDKINLLTTNDITQLENFINPFINQILVTNIFNVIVINALEFNLDENSKKYYNYYDNNFNEIFDNLLKYVKVNYENFKNNNYNKNIFANIKPVLCIILGVNNFQNKLNEENKNHFNVIFENITDMGIINYVFADSFDKIKTYEMEKWYKNSVNNSNGIWIGNGIDDQYFLKVTKRIPEVKQEIQNDFCFVVKKGVPKLVKFVSKFDLK